MPVPNFLIIGAQKSGTTWVSHRLMQHPQVFIEQGTYFFDNPTHFARGVNWYSRCFEAGAGKAAIGEKTPSYLWGEKFPASGEATNVPRRVRDVLPHAKLIIVLRNPVTRAVSQFNHSIRSGKLSPFVNIDAALTGRRPDAVRGLGIFERGLYSRQIERWFQFFPREQFQILVFERDVMQQPLPCLDRLCRFLSIDPAFQFKTVANRDNEKLSKIELILKYYVPPLRRVLRPIIKRLAKESFRPQSATLAHLHEAYAEERERLATLVGVELSCWERARSAAA